MAENAILWGLIGYPLGHSFSGQWFADKFAKEGLTGAEYRTFPIALLESFRKLLLAEPALSGLNVTIPYKEKIIPYLNEMDETARRIGAVNTITIRQVNGNLWTKGYNTDAEGFLRSLPAILNHRHALILGTGGAARAVAFALQMKNIDYCFVSRDKKGKGILSYANLTPEVIALHTMIINATPAGMFPDAGHCPDIPYQYITGNHFLYDLVYNPGETLFMKRGKAMNALTMNGFQMLVNQAELSFGIFMKCP